MSTISARNRNNHRKTDRFFAIALISTTIVILAFIVITSWLHGRRIATPPAAENSPDLIMDSDLFPLAEPVNPISGFHDMPNMPQAGDERPLRVEAGIPHASVNLPFSLWDWGTIPARPSVQQIFPIQNNGDESLIISSVVTSCGCTTAYLSNSVIPPGQRADLTVTFDPDYHETSGPVTRVVWMKTNDPEMPLVELRMNANVVP